MVPTDVKTMSSLSAHSDSMSIEMNAKVQLTSEYVPPTEEELKAYDVKEVVKAQKTP